MHPLKPGDLLDYTSSEVAALIDHLNALEALETPYG
jgi:hypothetical protein